MREIKFRAWDGKEYKEMYSWSYIRDENLQELMDAGIILMQYTGLRDKNGVEIYEGDIVRAFGRWNAKVVFNSRYIEGDDMLAGYHVLGWWLDVEAEQSLDQIHLECEVIGNIYENSELMNI